MDSEIKASVEDAYRTEHETGLLCDGQSRSLTTFVAVQRLAQTSNLAVLSDAPEWLRAELARWIEIYRSTGEFSFHSKLGKVDHSPLMKAAVRVLG